LYLSNTNTWTHIETFTEHGKNALSIGMKRKTELSTSIFDYYPCNMSVFWVGPERIKINYTPA
jgi:hypothetical protein